MSALGTAAHTWGYFTGVARMLGNPLEEALLNHDLFPRRLRPDSPSLNAFVERWIQLIQIECLDPFVVLGGAHLNYLAVQYVAYFEDEQSQQSLGNNLIAAAKSSKDDVSLLGQVKCRDRLGGLLKHCERSAA